MTEWFQDNADKQRKANMEEVRGVIVALKDKLMERHLMSKKITELEKILRKINDATNKIIIEMNNRVDDLNRYWQERVENENLKWKNKLHASYNNSNKLTESKSSRKTNNCLWRMEQCLLELTERLPSAQKIDQKLEEIIEMLRTNHCYRSTAATDQLRISQGGSTTNTAKTAQNIQNDNSAATKDSNFYGVVEITESYSMCLRNLERAVKSLESIKRMSELFGISVEGITNVQDVNHAANVLQQFIDKLKISLKKCNLRNDDDGDISLYGDN
ncbi:unnamed protein product [Litomosoides sigmodontis]|uniref:Uncharacterized protein n=1 Tax=Litomosoides sigmodontis TaxID=42156 RepID=A0A3P6V685_LITSI|nr:unnamed protein product [Litomosoides sigmodontis]